MDERAKISKAAKEPWWRRITDTEINIQKTIQYDETTAKKINEHKLLEHFIFTSSEYRVVKKASKLQGVQDSNLKGRKN